MFYIIMNIAIIAFEAICCKLFYESFCDTPKGVGKLKKPLLMTLLVAGMFLSALLLSGWMIVKQLIVILLYVVIMWQYFSIGIRKSAILAILYQGLLLLIDYLVYAINTTLFLSGENIHNQYALAGTLIISAGKMILFLCVIMIKKQFGRKKIGMIADTEWLRFLFFPVFTIIIIIALTMTFPYINNEKQANVLYTIAFGMVGMNLLVYYLINAIVEREAKLHENAMFQIQVKNQTEMYRSISENFDAQKRRTHEFKNHILCIESLIKEQQYEKLDKYIMSISRKFDSEQNAINTNNVIINAILNSKHQEAIKKGIVFVCKVNDLSDVKMEDEDIVILLANLLNNAIEACEKCEDKKVVKLKFIYEDKTLILSVKNTYSQPIIYEGGEIRTSKVNAPEEHGVGIKNILKIVDKYDGSYVMDNDDDEFYISIMFAM